MGVSPIVYKHLPPKLQKLVSKPPPPPPPQTKPAPKPAPKPKTSSKPKVSSGVKKVLSKTKTGQKIIKKIEEPTTPTKPPTQPIKSTDPLFKVLPPAAQNVIRAGEGKPPVTTTPKPTPTQTPLEQKLSTLGPGGQQLAQKIQEIRTKPTQPTQPTPTGPVQPEPTKPPSPAFMDFLSKTPAGAKIAEGIIKQDKTLIDKSKEAQIRKIQQTSFISVDTSPEDVMKKAKQYVKTENINEPITRQQTLLVTWEKPDGTTTTAHTKTSDLNWLQNNIQKKYGGVITKITDIDKKVYYQTPGPSEWKNAINQYNDSVLSNQKQVYQQTGYIPDWIKNTVEVPQEIANSGATKEYIDLAYKDYLNLSTKQAKEKLQQKLQKSSWYMSTQPIYEGKTFSELKKEHPALYLTRNPKTGEWIPKMNYIRWKKEYDKATEAKAGGLAVGAKDVAHSFLSIFDPGTWTAAWEGKLAERQARKQYEDVQKIKAGKGWEVWVGVQIPAYTNVILPLAGGALLSKGFTAVGAAGKAAAGTTTGTVLTGYATYAPYVIGGTMSALVGADIGKTKALEDKGILPKGSTAQKLIGLGMQVPSVIAGSKLASMRIGKGAPLSERLAQGYQRVKGRIPGYEKITGAPRKFAYQQTQAKIRYAQQHGMRYDPRLSYMERLSISQPKVYKTIQTVKGKFSVPKKISYTELRQLPPGYEEALPFEEPMTTKQFKTPTGPSYWETARPWERIVFMPHGKVSSPKGISLAGARGGERYWYGETRPMRAYGLPEEPLGPRIETRPEQIMRNLQKWSKGQKLVPEKITVAKEIIRAGRLKATGYTEPSTRLPPTDYFQVSMGKETFQLYKPRMYDPTVRRVMSEAWKRAVYGYEQPVSELGLPETTFERAMIQKPGLAKTRAVIRASKLEAKYGPFTEPKTPMYEYKKVIDYKTGRIKRGYVPKESIAEKYIYKPKIKQTKLKQFVEKPSKLKYWEDVVGRKLTPAEGRQAIQGVRTAIQWKGGRLVPGKGKIFKFEPKTSKGIEGLDYGKQQITQLKTEAKTDLKSGKITKAQYDNIITQLEKGVSIKPKYEFRFTKPKFIPYQKPIYIPQQLISDEYKLKQKEILRPKVEKHLKKLQLAELTKRIRKMTQDELNSAIKRGEISREQLNQIKPLNTVKQTIGDRVIEKRIYTEQGHKQYKQQQKQFKQNRELVKRLIDRLNRERTGLTKEQEKLHRAFLDAEEARLINEFNKAYKHVVSPKEQTEYDAYKQLRIQEKYESLRKAADDIRKGRKFVPEELEPIKPKKSKYGSAIFFDTPTGRIFEYVAKNPQGAKKLKELQKFYKEIVNESNNLTQRLNNRELVEVKIINKHNQKVKDFAVKKEKLKIDNDIDLTQPRSRLQIYRYYDLETEQMIEEIRPVYGEAPVKRKYGVLKAPRLIRTPALPLSLRAGLYPHTVKKIKGYKKGKPEYDTFFEPPKPMPTKPKVELKKPTKPEWKEIQSGRLGLISQEKPAKEIVEKTKKQLKTIKQKQKTSENKTKKQIKQLNKFAQDLYKYSQTTLLPTWQQRKIRNWINRIRGQIRKLDTTLALEKNSKQKIDELEKQAELLALEELTVQDREIVSKIAQDISSVQGLQFDVAQEQGQAQTLITFLVQEQDVAQEQDVELPKILIQVPVTISPTISTYPEFRPKREEVKKFPSFIPPPEEYKKKKRIKIPTRKYPTKYKERKFILPTFAGALKQQYIQKPYKPKPYKAQRVPKTLRY